MEKCKVFSCARERKTGYFCLVHFNDWLGCSELEHPAPKITNISDFVRRIEAEALNGSKK